MSLLSIVKLSFIVIFLLVANLTLFLCIELTYLLLVNTLSFVERQTLNIEHVYHIRLYYKYL